MNLSNKSRRFALVLGFVGVGSLALQACGWNAKYPDDDNVADAGNPVEDNGTPVVDAGTPPTDNGIAPFACSPGIETDPADCLEFAVPGTTHMVCNATGNGSVCMLRPGCTIRGCSMMPNRVCPTPGAEISSGDCQPGAAPGTTHRVCNGDGSAIVCVLRPGCSLTGCIQPMPDGGVPMMPDAGTDPGPYVTLDERCDGLPLTARPEACADLSSGRRCFHACQLTPAYLRDSSHPNAEQRPTSIRLIQTEDPSRPLDIGTFAAPPVLSNVQRWEAGAYVAIRPAPAAFPLFNGRNGYERAVTGPFAYLWAAGQNFRGMGLERNGRFRLYEVNANLTQTLLVNEIVANEPANVGTPVAYYNGGNFHPLGTGCPFYLTERTVGDFRCTP